MSDFDMRLLSPSTLIIDDDEDILNSVRRLSRAVGHEVLIAATWKEGLALFHALSPDLVIADYNLPGSQHGLKLLAEIRSVRPSVRLILISGIVEPNSLTMAASLAVVDRVLSKGDSTATLEVLLEEIGRAAEGARRTTDWRAVARAHVSASNLDQQEFERIDALFESHAREDDDG